MNDQPIEKPMPFTNNTKWKNIQYGPKEGWGGWFKKKPLKKNENNGERKPINEDTLLRQYKIGKRDLDDWQTDDILQNMRYIKNKVNNPMPEEGQVNGKEMNNVNKFEQCAEQSEDANVGKIKESNNNENPFNNNNNAVGVNNANKPENPQESNPRKYVNKPPKEKLTYKKKQIGYVKEDDNQNNAIANFNYPSETMIKPNNYWWDDYGREDDRLNDNKQEPNHKQDPNHKQEKAILEEAEVDYDDTITMDKFEKYIEHHGGNAVLESPEYSKKAKKDFIEDTIFSSTIYKTIPWKAPLTHIFEMNRNGLEAELNEKVSLIWETKDPSVGQRWDEALRKRWWWYDLAPWYKKWYFPISPCFQIHHNEEYSNTKGKYPGWLCFRSVVKDGDSFYRCFIFSYLEKAIIYNRDLDLQRWWYNFIIKIGKPFKNNNTPIKKREVVYILNQIIYEVQKKNTNTAVKWLNRAFCKSPNFDVAMVKYTKIILGEYLKRNWLNFDYDELESQEMVNKNYWRPNTWIQGNNKTNLMLNVDEYWDDRVYSMKTNPDVLLCYLIQFAFKVYLKIYVVQWKCSNIIEIQKHQRAGISGKVNEIDDGPKDDEYGDLWIDIIYKDKSFQIGYNDKYYYTNWDNWNYNLISNESNDKDVKKALYEDSEFKILNKNTMCNTCHTKTNEIIISHIPICTFCQQCWTDNLGNVLKKRIKYFYEENFRNYEYYTQPIQIGPKSDYKIFDKDWMKLTNFTIAGYMVELMKKICYTCGEEITSSNSVKMPCGCNLHKLCVLKSIEDLTKTHIYISEFEKELYQVKPAICQCGCAFDFNIAWKAVYSNAEINEAKLNCISRLNTYMKNYCMSCGKEWHNKNEKKIPIRTIVKSIEAKNESNLHYMCEICLGKYYDHIEKQISLGKYSESIDEISIKCKICFKLDYISFIQLKKDFKRVRDKCCFIF